MEKSKHKSRTVKMVVEYDGTDYNGWQSQINGVSIQSAIEKQFKKMLGKRVPVIASGRTDAGVHAMGQVVHVRGAFPIDDARLLRALNSFLPFDISIRSLETVSDKFHAIRDAKWKLYRYIIHNSPVPSALCRRTSWFMPTKINLRKMRSAAKLLVGKHDFVSFMSSGSSVRGTVREIISLDIKKRGEMVIIEAKANGFLKHMVRNIVGTLVEIGRDRMPEDAMAKILAAKDRRKAGPAAPGRGLFLVEVNYK